MWTCANCREVLEDQFDACWNCGCSREGKLNLEFVNDAEPTSVQRSVMNGFSQSFVCQRCKGREAQLDRISTRGTGLGALLRKDYLAVSCANCGLTEFYSLNVLEGRTDLENLLRGIFGT